MNEAKAVEVLDSVGEVQREKQIPTLCPRCGKDSLRTPIHTNALSRHADCYICSECGTDEAIRDYNGTSIKASEWYFITCVLDILNEEEDAE